MGKSEQQGQVQGHHGGKVGVAGVNRKGKCDEELADAKKGDRSRLGNLGGPAAEENGLLARLSNELDAIIKDEWSISRSDWVEFIENDLKKGGKSIHSITRLAEPPPCHLSHPTLSNSARPSPPAPM